MRRNLWAGPRLVKRAQSAVPRVFARIWAHLGPAVAGCWALGWALGCGGGPPPKPPADPYGPRIAQCIDAPRALSDAAIDHMVPVAGFTLDRNPVTNGAYAESVAACGAASPQAENVALLRADEPVVQVTHDEAAFYCAWRGGRLPTADEWSRAGELIGTARAMEWTSTRAQGRDGHVLVVGRGVASRVLPVDQRDINLGFRCAH